MSGDYEGANTEPAPADKPDKPRFTRGDVANMVLKQLCEHLAEPETGKALITITRNGDHLRTEVNSQGISRSVLITSLARAILQLIEDD